MVIAVMNSKGGVGKSTLAVHLATWLHEQGLRVAVVDADAQGSTGHWLQRAAPEVPQRALTSAAGLLRGLPELAGGHDVVLADGPASLGAENAALAAGADLCLLPIGPSMLDVWATYRVARLVYKVRFDSRQPDRPRAFTVISRAPRGRRLVQIAATAIHHFGFPTARQTIPYREAFIEACAQGTVVWRLGRRGAGCRQALERLFLEVLDAGTAPPAAPPAGAGARS